MSRLDLKPRQKPFRAFCSLSASNGERAGKKRRSLALARLSINPNLGDAAEEILFKHLLIERLFPNVFNRSDFTRRTIDDWHKWRGVTD